ncbi:MAG: YfcE family phosphodiesterase [Candidatus Staskawiczbacteria bacterium]
MKIAIVSDTHNNWPNFKKAINWIGKENIKLILHCGDICGQDIIDDSVKAFDGEIKFVKGNGDFNLDLPEKIEFEIDGKKIAFCHFPDMAKKTAQSGKFDLVFYGHTHRPWDEKIGKCHMINPGELAGQFYKPSFAIYDTVTGSLELKILENI